MAKYTKSWYTGLMSVGGGIALLVALFLLFSNADGLVIAVVALAGVVAFAAADLRDIRTLLSRDHSSEE